MPLLPTNLSLFLRLLLLLLLKNFGTKDLLILIMLLCNMFFLQIYNDSLDSSCQACQLGKQIKQPFYPSVSNVSKPFEIIHSDVWTSPLESMSGIKYYVLFLDHYTQFLWVYPLRRKSEVFSKFLHFLSYVETQFNSKIQSFQCDNGGSLTTKTFIICST